MRPEPDDEEWRTRHAGDGECPIAHTLRVLGTTKWTGYVIRELLDGTPHRFGEIRRGIGDAGPKPLTETLRTMEEVGLVHRTAYAEVPPRVEYVLTDRGRSLAPVLAAMSEWGVQDLDGSTDGRTARGR